jgi:hypothetical protein
MKYSDPGRTETQMNILACVHALPGKLPRSGIAKLLVGSESQRVADYKNHPDYGRLAHLPRKVVVQEIDALLNCGDLDLDDKSRVIVRRKQ